MQKTNMCCVLSVALTVAAFAASSAARAQVTEYEKSSFEAAAPSLTTFNFDGLVPTGTNKNYPDGITVEGVRFTNKENSLSVDAPGTSTKNPFRGDDYLYANPSPTPPGSPPGYSPSIDISPPLGTYAFGFDFSSFSLSPGSSLTIAVNNETFLLQAPLGFFNGSAFVGFISDSPIASLSISPDACIDNVSFGPAAVPEASTTVSLGLLLMLGLGGLAAGRKKASGAA